MPSAPDVTLLTVVHDAIDLFALNVAHTRWLNGEHAGAANVTKWLVVDNRVGDGEAGARAEGGWPDGVTVIPGAARTDARDAGSRHHADGLHCGLAHVRTRFVLVLDPDFYVLIDGWIERVVAHAEARGLALFGSAWHPRWTSQFRNFPSIHCLLVDGRRLPFERLDLRPRIHEDAWWQRINDESRWVPLRGLLKRGRIRDTGSELHRLYRRDPAILHEELVPHWTGPRRLASRAALRVGAALGRRLPWAALETTRATPESFLRRDFPDAYADHWEEFFWQGRPFAFHLRQVGRQRLGSATASDAERVAAVLAAYRDRPPG
ncbi:MAG: hypothetical protein U1F43_20110 [Myxococcota bacterium]